MVEKPCCAQGLALTPTHTHPRPLMRGGTSRGFLRSNNVEIPMLL